MSKKEELEREFTELTKKSVQIDKKLRLMEPFVANLSSGEQMKIWIPFEETIKEYEKFKREQSDITKRRQVIVLEINSLKRMKS